MTRLPPGELVADEETPGLLKDERQSWQIHTRCAGLLGDITYPVAAMLVG